MCLQYNVLVWGDVFVTTETTHILFCHLKMCKSERWSGDCINFPLPILLNRLRNSSFIIVKYSTHALWSSKIWIEHSQNVKLYVFPQYNNIFERYIGIGSILDELNALFFQNCYLKLIPMNFDEEYWNPIYILLW